MDSQRRRPRLVLASASPARLRSLRAAGIDAEAIVSGVDESIVDSPTPDVLCLTLARLKAQAVAQRAAVNRPGATPATLVLGCDSVLALGGEVLGKPPGPAEAAARWRAMRGREGILHTGHHLVDLDSGKAAEAVASTTVRFADVSDAEIAAYVATGEPLRVAGAFTIDGIGGAFVESIDGNPGTVIGLSLPLLRRLLADLGIPITSLWRDGLASERSSEASDAVSVTVAPMTTRSLTITEDLYAYLVAHGATPDPVAQELITETHTTLAPVAQMQIAPDQAAFLTLMTRIVGVRHAVEVGTFTGYSALAIARGLAEGGKLICCDISEEYTSVARRYWAEGGVADRIELRIGPAADTLRGMPTDPHIDLAFIDADKSSYPIYWAELVPRMRTGGVILIDNVLRGGRVLRPESPDDVTIVDFNKAVVADDRVDAVMLPIADGLTVARKR